MLTKTAHIFAHHGGLDLECDIYGAPHSTPSSPVFLFFHSGGLVGSSKERIPPWLVQACHRRKWPLISAAYRLLPQTGPQGLLEDVTAAYKFAISYNTGSGGVIVGGASAGFFMATLTAHHNLSPPPLALLSITGIATFQHPFFSSSVCLTPSPLSEADMAVHLSGPIVVGTSPPGTPAVFTLDKLTADGAKDPAYTPPIPREAQSNRGMLYDYYLYHNAFPALVADIDPGYGSGPPTGDWPPTVIVHGDTDDDVSLDVSIHMRESLGEDKVKLFIAEGQGHLFEDEAWWEDETRGMDVVREAVACLDSIVPVTSR